LKRASVITLVFWQDEVRISRFTTSTDIGMDRRTLRTSRFQQRVHARGYGIIIGVLISPHHRSFGYDWALGVSRDLTFGARVFGSLYVCFSLIE
jgi:hypothetical protein